ncbi:MAG TPA: ComF family protein [Coriobacteriia bacterium]
MSGMSARLMRLAFEAAAELLWPARCAGCDLPGVMLCASCGSALHPIRSDTACPRCGAPDGVHGCAECGRTELVFERARCAGVFEWPLDRMIRLHKDAGELRLTDPLAMLVAHAAGEWCDWAQAVVPAPTSPGAIARRGFDHGAQLVAAFSALTGVPALDVLRARPRRDQRGLTRESRAANARASIVPLQGAAVPQRVLLLDDVFTTGATLDAAAAALMSAGAGEVRALAVARACGGRL